MGRPPLNSWDQGDNPAPKTVAIDFDGVISDYKGWVDGNTLYPPMDGAAWFIQRCLNEGYKVVVFTTRRTTNVVGWLQDYNFPDVEVTNKKPTAMVYIDDRGFRFNKDWDAAWEAITMRTHWEPE